MRIRLLGYSASENPYRYKTSSILGNSYVNKTFSIFGNPYVVYTYMNYVNKNNKL